MLDSDMPFEYDMSLSGYDDENDNDAGEDYEEDEDHTDENSLGSPSSAIDNASPQEVEAHRNMLGEAMQHLANEGIDIDEIAEDAGINSSDVDALSHEDLASLTHYVAQNHPEVMQTVSDRFPAAQGLLNAITGGGDEGIGGFFRKLI